MSNSTVMPLLMHSQPIGGDVQWDYRLQEILDSIKRGIEEAVRGEGQFLQDSDLETDDDD